MDVSSIKTDLMLRYSSRDLKTMAMQMYLPTEGSKAEIALRIAQERLDRLSPHTRSAEPTREHSGSFRAITEAKSESNAHLTLAKWLYSESTAVEQN